VFEETKETKSSQLGMNTAEEFNVQIPRNAENSKCGDAPLASLQLHHCEAE
jgi:hypothetical protein